MAWTVYATTRAVVASPVVLVRRAVGLAMSVTNGSESRLAALCGDLRKGLDRVCWRPSTLGALRVPCTKLAAADAPVSLTLAPLSFSLSLARARAAQRRSS